MASFKRIFNSAKHQPLNTWSDIPTVQIQPRRSDIEGSQLTREPQNTGRPNKVANRTASIIDGQWASPPPSYEESQWDTCDVPANRPSSPAPTYRSMASTLEPNQTESESEIVDHILIDLVVFVKKFECPSKLDFSAYPENPMSLAENETNEQFIEQLRRIERLRNRLANIQPYDEEMIAKHQATGTAIALALQRMKQRQLKLYEKCKQETAEFLDLLYDDLIGTTKMFEYPSELDFLESSEYELVLPITPRNKPFISQLRELEMFRDQVNATPTYQSAQLESKHREINAAIGQALQKMKNHQLRLYEQFIQTSSQSAKALEELHNKLMGFVDSLVYTPFLEVSRNSSGRLVLLDSTWNESFKFQLDELESFRDQLNKISTHDNAELKRKHRDLSVRIGQVLQGMKKHQLDCFEQSQKSN